MEKQQAFHIYIWLVLVGSFWFVYVKLTLNRSTFVSALFGILLRASNVVKRIG